MRSSTAIARIAKGIGQELQSGRGPGDGIHTAGPMLAQAGAAPEIVTGLFSESRRKRPDDRALAGYAFLLETALESLRLDVNGGDLSGRQAIEAVRDAAGAALAAAPVEPGAMMLVARAFGRAGLDPGPALQSIVAQAMEAQSAAGPGKLTEGDLTASLDELAGQLDHDPFAIHAELAASGGAFPAEHRLAMAAALAASGTDALREAALGFVLSPDPEIAAAVLHALARPAGGGPVASATVERLVLMRPWLSPARREPVDAAVCALRPRASAPEPASRPDMVRVLASMCDGAGTQSLFALTRQGQRLVMASILLKAEDGVADALVGDPMTRREADGLIREIASAAEGVDVSPALLRRRLADALVVNAARDRPPPFGLVQVAERLGLAPLHPQAIDPAGLARELLAELPAERTGQKAEQAAHRASADWEERIATTSSWFEAGEAVETLLRPLKSRKQRTDAVMRDILPLRRGFWAGLCAWTAATLKDCAKPGDATWCEFALVARALAGDQPLDTIPLARRIAAATVEAFTQR